MGTPIMIGIPIMKGNILRKPFRNGKDRSIEWNIKYK